MVAVPAPALAIWLLTGEAFWALSALFAAAAVATIVRVAQGRQDLTTAWRGGLLGMLAWLSATVVGSGGQPADATLFSATPLLFAAAGFVAEILFPGDAKKVTATA